MSLYQIGKLYLKNATVTSQNVTGSKLVLFTLLYAWLIKCDPHIWHWPSFYPKELVYQKWFDSEKYFSSYRTDKPKLGQILGRNFT